MQISGTDLAPGPPVVPDPLGWDGLTGSATPSHAAAQSGPQPGPEQGWLASLWANEKSRQGLIVGCGIAVVCVGVVIALLAGGGGKPAAVSLGEALARSYDSYGTTGDGSRRPSVSSAPGSTAPSAAAAAPVGDTTTQPKSSGSPYQHPDDDGDRPNGDPVAEVPAMVCPGTDARCGPFRWEPAVPPESNLPLVITAVRVSVGGAPAAEFSGEAGSGTVSVDGATDVQVQVTAADPDAWIGRHQCWNAAPPEGVEYSMACTAEVELVPSLAGKTYAYGAVRPPAPEAGQYDSGSIPLALPEGVTGAFTFQVKVVSGGDPACGVAPNLVRCTPYANEATFTLTVEVSQ